MDSQFPKHLDPLDLSRSESYSPAPETPTAVEGQMGSHDTTAIPGERIVIRVKHPSESEATPLATPGTKGFEYWPGETEEPEEEVESKEPRSFSDETVIGLVRGSNTKSARAILSKSSEKTKQAMAFISQKEKEASATSLKKYKSPSSLTASAGDLLSISVTTPSIGDTVYKSKAFSTSTTNLDQISHPARIAVAYIHDALTSEKQAPLCELPAQAPFRPDALSGDFCVPVSASFKRSGNDFPMTDEQSQSVLRLSPVATSLKKQLMDLDDVEDRYAFKQAITDSNLTIQIMIGDSYFPVYSSAAAFGSLKEEGRAGSWTRKSSLPTPDEVAESSASVLNTALPGAEPVVNSLVQNNTALEAAQNYAGCHGFEIAPKAQRRATSSYTVTAVNHDEFRVDITSVYNELHNKTLNKTHDGFLEANLSVRFVREGDLWAPKGCACSFDIETDSRKAQSRYKLADEIKKAYSSEKNTGKKAVQEARRKLKSPRTSQHSLPSGFAERGSQSNLTKTKPLNQSLSAGMNFRVNLAPSFMRQKSEEYSSHLRLQPGHLVSSSGGSSDSQLLSPSSGHSRQDSLVSQVSTGSSSKMSALDSLHSRQDSSISEVGDQGDYSTNPVAGAVSPEARPVCLEKVGTQLYLTNIDAEKAQAGVSGAEVVQRYTKKMVEETRRLTKPPKSSDSLELDIIHKLAKGASNLAQATPSDKLFEQYMNTVRRELQKKFGDQAKNFPEAPAIQAELTALNQEFTKEWFEFLAKTEAAASEYTPPAIHDDWKVSLTEEQVKATQAAMDAVKEDCDGFRKVLAGLEKVAKEGEQCKTHLFDHSEKTEATPAQKDLFSCLYEIATLHCQSIKIVDNFRANRRTKGPTKHRKLQDAIELSLQNEEHKRILAHLNVLKSEINMLKAMCSVKTEEVLLRLRASHTELDGEIKTIGETITAAETIEPHDILTDQRFARDTRNLEQMIESLPEEKIRQLKIAFACNRPVSSEELDRLENATNLYLAYDPSQKTTLPELIRELAPYFNDESDGSETIKENIVAFLETLV